MDTGKWKLTLTVRLQSPIYNQKLCVN